MQDIKVKVADKIEWVDANEVIHRAVVTYVDEAEGLLDIVSSTSPCHEISASRVVKVLRKK